MRVPRLRFTLVRMMAAVAVVAVLMAMGKIAFTKCMGPREGVYYGSYRYLGSDWRWHEVRGGVIFVKDRMILVE